MDSNPENYLHYISLQTYRSLVDIDSIDREVTLKLDLYQICYCVTRVSNRQGRLKF